MPVADALVQTNSHHHHKKHKHKNMLAVRRKQKKARDDEIHGYMEEQMDDRSPYDPDVVDAPEDMHRVGNDHEELHNAKLSPDGYYDGFFHKDY